MDKGELITKIAAMQDEQLSLVIAFVEKTLAETSNSELKTIRIHKGLSLYRNGSSPYWWCRISMPKKGAKEVRKSTNESEISRAKHAALMMSVEELTRFELGVTDTSSRLSWPRVCQEVLAILEEQSNKEIKAGRIKPQAKVHASIIKNKIAGFAGFRRKSIGEIDYVDLCDLMESDNFFNASKTVINNARKSLNIILEFAMRQRYIEVAPKIPSVKGAAEEEVEPFNEKDLKVLLSNFLPFYENSRNSLTRNLRKQFPYYFNLLCTTGMRTGEEPLCLKWADLKVGQFQHDGAKKRGYFVDIRSGKMAKKTKGKKFRSHSREVVLNQAAVMTLEKLYTVRFGLKKNINEIIAEAKNTYIFIGNGDKKPDFAGVFKQYLTYLNGQISSYYTLYSCRHEYINAELNRGMKQADIAEQCGNSSATIDAYYKKYKAMNRAARILSEADIIAFNNASSDGNT